MEVGQRNAKQFKIITQKEFKELRQWQWERQHEICPVLKIHIDLEEAAFDHKHKRKGDPIGIKGNGLLRGILHKEVNRFEGKMVQFYKRYGLEKFCSLPYLLRNLADYLEHPPMRPEYIHPKENPKPLKLSKTDFNRVVKHWSRLHKKKKLPVFPKSKKISKQMKADIEQCDQWGWY